MGIVEIEFEKYSFLAQEQIVFWDRFRPRISPNSEHSWGPSYMT